MPIQITSSDDQGATSPATRDMVHRRTHEMAVSAGRSRTQITHSDYLRARRELTGESDFSRQDLVLDGKVG